MQLLGGGGGGGGAGGAGGGGGGGDTQNVQAEHLHQWVQSLILQKLAQPVFDVSPCFLGSQAAPVAATPAATSAAERCSCAGDGSGGALLGLLVALHVLQARHLQ